MGCGLVCASRLHNGSRRTGGVANTVTKYFLPARHEPTQPSRYPATSAAWQPRHHSWIFPSINRARKGLMIQISKWETLQEPRAEAAHDAELQFNFARQVGLRGGLTGT